MCTYTAKKSERKKGGKKEANNPLPTLKKIFQIMITNYGNPQMHKVPIILWVIRGGL